jgi:hypothetical protein
MEAKAREAWKMPPIAKVYEAIGAIGDGRVKIMDERHAAVTSSDGSKTYAVELSAAGHEISSNDNSSYWQGYLGYPAIAVMIARGFYQLRKDVIQALSGIPWKELNRRFRNNYERTIAEVIRRAEDHGYDSAAIRAETDAVLAAVREYAPLRGTRRPPPRIARRPRQK